MLARGRIKEGQVWDSVNVFRGDESMGLKKAFADDLINNLEKGTGFVPQMIDGKETPRFVVNRSGEKPIIEQLTPINQIQQIVALYFMVAYQRFTTARDDKKTLFSPL